MPTDYKDKGLNLLRRGQKGIIHAIFSRFGLVLLMLVVQVLILFSILQWFWGVSASYLERNGAVYICYGDLSSEQ